eukprot:UN20908
MSQILSLPAENYIVQQYIERPLLIGNKKFDLRLYVLVVNYNPLIVYLHRGGFARFTSAKYTLDPDQLENSYVHLTNVAVQKHCDDYDSDVGLKWSIRNLKMYMFAKYGDR